MASPMTDRAEFPVQRNKTLKGFRSLASVMGYFLR
jgi:hypothetical protein